MVSFIITMYLLYVMFIVTYITFLNGNLTLKFYMLGESFTCQGALLELGFVQFIPIMPFAFKLYMFSNFIIFQKKIKGFLEEYFFWKIIKFETKILQDIITKSISSEANRKIGHKFMQDDAMLRCGF